MIVGCESLFVAYDPEHAGLLFTVAASGMLFGDVLTGRFLPERLRGRLAAPLRLLLAAPFVVFVVEPPLPVAMVAVALATVGFSASPLLQNRLMALTPSQMSGQALGLHSSGMLAMQGLSAALAGAQAEYSSPAVATGVLAAASVVVTLALAPGLRPLERPGDTKGSRTCDRKPLSTS